jgi:alpha-beta hydrolase superfamily lysophospholipase
VAGPALPRLEAVGRPPATTAGVVLVLHGGSETSRASADPRGAAYMRMLPFARMLVRRGRRAGARVFVLRYRYRGWNEPERDPVGDTRWALGEVAARHPGMPIVLVGHSMGGRAALQAAGAPGVVAVCALAPWVVVTDPVEQLAGRAVLIAHGDRDTRTDPRESLAYARRAAKVSDRVEYREVRGAGHAMLRKARTWSALVRRFVLGVLRGDADAVRP